MKASKIAATVCAAALAMSMSCGAAFAYVSPNGGTTPSTVEKNDIVKVNAKGQPAVKNTTSQYVGVSNNGKVTLSYQKVIKKSCKTAHIRAKVSGVKVTGVKAKVFKGTKVKTVKVSSTAVKASAVKKAIKGSKVKTIKVKSSMVKAYKKAFKGTGVAVKAL